jgi:cytochrome c oxidase accessory protein FixG
MDPVEPLTGHSRPTDRAAAAKTAPLAASASQAPATAPAAPREAVISLYEKRQEIYPRARVGDHLGRFARWRWALVWLTQLVFYGTPWLRWHERQAVLFDLVARKFYLFDLVLWPQDVIYLTGILVISALSLFLFTAVGGRLWCGYACPQTVYTEIFLWIERQIEGDRSQRMALDKQAMSARKFARKGLKHAVWMAVGLWTGFTFVGFFSPIRELAGAVASAALGPWETFWILFYAFATYGNAGWLREQVCTYMCPYARFQSAMFDRDTLIVTYDEGRGEPRGIGRKSRARAQDNLGDCVDCGFCVQVCPTGIDIRAGLQYQCIGCAACIDACDYVMGKNNLPAGLIRYTTTNALSEHLTRAQIWRHVLRLRVLIYGLILGSICVAMVVSLSLRVPLKVDVIRDRGSFAREVADGQVENVYRLQIMNTSAKDGAYRMQAQGLPGLSIASEADVAVPAASSQTVIVRLRAPAASASPGANRIALQLTSTTDAAIEVREKTVFFGLRP